MGNGLEGYESYQSSEGPVVVNATGLPYQQIVDGVESLTADSTERMVAKLIRTTNGMRPPHRYGGILSRDKYLTPQNPIDQMRVAREALHDDIVSGAADASEHLSLSSISIYSSKLHEQAIWNRWSEYVDFTSVLRSAWRTMFTDSQFVCATWWKDMALDLADGSIVNIIAPSAMTVIDTTRVIPVGMLMFGQEQLAYVASPMEAARFDDILEGRPAQSFTGPWYEGIGQFDGAPDPLVARLIVGRYHPDGFETQQLLGDGVGTVDNLFLLNPQFVWRHTLSRPDFQRFSDVRLASVFELLDLKSQLHQADRTNLLGAANYILLITQGSEKAPLLPQEHANLLAGAQQIGSVPYIVGDYRLKVEIISPKTDFTLDEKRYDNLDMRIFTRLYETFVHSSQNRSNDDVKTGSVIARGLEGRRDQIGHSFENHVFDFIRQANRKVFTSRALLNFHPNSVAISFDPGRADSMHDARMAGEISRETYLSELRLSEDIEAQRRLREKESYDSIFLTQDPHGTPNPANQGPDAPPEPDPEPDPAPQDPAPQGPNGALPKQEIQRRAGRQGGGNRGDGGAGRPNDGHGKSSASEEEDGLLGICRDDLIAIAGQYKVPGRYQMRKQQLIDEIRAMRDDEEQ